VGQKCINCGKPATVNIQKLWIKWEYDAKRDEYSTEHEILDIEPSDSENLHLCKKCMKLWERGDI
jgi:hypothetical protein